MMVQRAKMASSVLVLLVVLPSCGYSPSSGGSGSSGSSTSSDNVVFEAQVEDTAGVAIGYGHVLIYDSESGSVLGSEEIDEQGRFRIVISRPHREPRYVRVVAPFYKTLGFPFVVPIGTRSVEASVELASNVKLRPENVQIGIGDVDPVEMERRADGTFVYVLGESEGPVSYYVTGASVEGGRGRLPGSQRDRFSLAMNSLLPYYRAIVDEQSDDLSEIVYDPSVLPWADLGTHSFISPKDETLAAVVDIVRERDRAIYAIKLHGRANVQYDIHEVMARTYARVRAALSSDTEVLRAYAAAEVFDSLLAEVVTDVDRELALQALQTESRYWMWVRRLWCPRFGPSTNVLEDLAVRNPDRRVRAFAVAALGWTAKEKKDRERWIALYTELEQFSDLGDSVTALLRRLDPMTKIAVGSPCH